MRIGLIADIHADYDTLCMVLDRLEKVHQVNRILCAGDLCGYGPQPNEVIFLFRQSKIVTVRGNHDSPSKGIEDANAAYLRSLPLEWRDGNQLYMCHGLPGLNMVGFTPEILQKEAVREMVCGVNASIIITGHTHEVLCEYAEGTWILNPGSVYALSQEGTSHSYGILDLKNMTFAVFDIQHPSEKPAHLYNITSLMD